MHQQQELLQERRILFWVLCEGVPSVRCGRWLTHVWHCGAIISAIKSSLGCPAQRKMQADWKVSRRKQWEEIKKREKRFKELNSFRAAKRKPLCNPVVCQHVIVVIKVPDFHGSLIYWFVNLPGWFRLDVVKISCYHHKTVARPPREARKPPLLGVVTDKRDDAVRTEAQVCCCPLVLVCRLPGLCFPEQGDEQEAAWPESGRWAKEGDWDSRTAGNEGGKSGMEESLWERDPHGTEMSVGMDSIGVKNAQIFPSPQL